MVTTERVADRRERAVGELAAEVHRDLAAKRYVLRALFRFQLHQPDMKEIGHGLLDRFNVGLDVMCANEIAQSLAGRLPRYPRPAHPKQWPHTRQEYLAHHHP